MSRYIDAEFEIEHYTKITTHPTPDVSKKDKRDSLIILEALRKAKSIDIVRCKECIENDINLSGTDNWCLHFGYDVEDDGFCNYGERVDEPKYYDPALHE